MAAPTSTIIMVITMMIVERQYHKFIAVYECAAGITVLLWQ